MPYTAEQKAAHWQANRGKYNSGKRERYNNGSSFESD